MAPLHSLVDNLRFKNKCHQKEGVTLRFFYILYFFTLVHVFAIHPISFSQSYGRLFDEVQACASWDVTKCDIVGVILVGDNVDDLSKSQIWNDTNSNNIEFVHNSVTVPFFFLWYVVGVARLWCIIFEKLEVGWASWFSGTQNLIRGRGVSQLLRAYNKAKTLPFSCNWNWRILAMYMAML